MRSITAMIAALSLGCAHLASPQVVPVDTDAVLRVMGRFGSAHACPVGENIALTAAHVTDVRPFDNSFAALPLVWSNLLGGDGILVPDGVSLMRDIAVMSSERPFAKWYAIAAEAPAPGDTLTTVGYDFRTQSDAFAPRIFEVKLLRIVARTLFFDPTITPGTSGSCVLNARGDVVGIITGGMTTEDGEVGIASGIYGERFPK